MGTARLGPLLRICCFELLIVAAYVAARGAVAAVSTQTWAQNHFELLPEAQIYIQNKDNLRRLGNVTANTAVIGAPQKWSQFSLPLVPVDAASLRLDIFPGARLRLTGLRIDLQWLARPPPPSPPPTRPPPPPKPPRQPPLPEYQPPSPPPPPRNRSAGGIGGIIIPVYGNYTPPGGYGGPVPTGNVPSTTPPLPATYGTDGGNTSGPWNEYDDDAPPPLAMAPDAMGQETRSMPVYGGQAVAKRRQQQQQQQQQQRRLAEEAAVKAVQQALRGARALAARGRGAAAPVASAGRAGAAAALGTVAQGAGGVGGVGSGGQGLRVARGHGRGGGGGGGRQLRQESGGSGSGSGGTGSAAGDLASVLLPLLPVLRLLPAGAGAGGGGAGSTAGAAASAVHMSYSTLLVRCGVLDDLWALQQQRYPEGGVGPGPGGNDTDFIRFAYPRAFIRSWSNGSLTAEELTITCEFSDDFRPADCAAARAASDMVVPWDVSTAEQLQAALAAISARQAPNCSSHASHNLRLPSGTVVGPPPASWPPGGFVVLHNLTFSVQAPNPIPTTETATTASTDTTSTATASAVLQGGASDGSPAAVAQLVKPAEAAYGVRRMAAAVAPFVAGLDLGQVPVLVASRAGAGVQLQGLMLFNLAHHPAMFLTVALGSFQTSRVSALQSRAPLHVVNCTMVVSEDELRALAVWASIYASQATRRPPPPPPPKTRPGAGSGSGASSPRAGLPTWRGWLLQQLQGLSYENGTTLSYTSGCFLGFTSRTCHVTSSIEVVAGQLAAAAAAAGREAPQLNEMSDMPGFPRLLDPLDPTISLLLPVASEPQLAEVLGLPMAATNRLIGGLGVPTGAATGRAEVVLYADVALNRSLWPAEGVSLALPTALQSEPAVSHTLDFGRGTAFVSGARGPLTVTGLMLQGAGWAANYSAEANGSVAAAQLQTRLWPFNTSSGTSGAGEQLIAGVSIVVSREEMLLLLSCAVRGGAALPVPSTPALAPSGGGGGGGGGDDDGGDGGGGGSAVPATPSGPPGTPLAPLAPPPPPPSKEAAAQQEAWDAWLSAVQDGAKQLPAGTCQALNAAGWQIALWPMKWTALPSGEMEVRVASARLSYGATWSSVVLRSSTAVVRADLQKLLFPSAVIAKGSSGGGHGGLSGGAIAGIVVGSVVGAVLLAVLALYLVATCRSGARTPTDRSYGADDSLLIRGMSPKNQAALGNILTAAFASRSMRGGGSGSPYGRDSHGPPQGRVSERALLAVSRSGGRDAPEPRTASGHGTATTIVSGAGTLVGSGGSGGSGSSLLPAQPSGSGMSASGAAASPGGGGGGGGAERSSVDRGSAASRAGRSLGMQLTVDVEAAALAAGVGGKTSTGIAAGNSPARLSVVEEGASAGHHTVGSASRRSADSVGRLAMAAAGGLSGLETPGGRGRASGTSTPGHAPRKGSGSQLMVAHQPVGTPGSAAGALSGAAARGSLSWLSRVMDRLRAGEPLDSGGFAPANERGGSGGGSGGGGSAGDRRSPTGSASAVPRGLPPRAGSGGAGSGNSGTASRDVSRTAAAGGGGGSSRGTSVTMRGITRMSDDFSASLPYRQRLTGSGVVPAADSPAGAGGGGAAAAAAGVPPGRRSGSAHGGQRTSLGQRFPGRGERGSELRVVVDLPSEEALDGDVGGDGSEQPSPHDEQLHEEQRDRPSARMHKQQDSVAAGGSRKLTAFDALSSTVATKVANRTSASSAGRSQSAVGGSAGPRGKRIASLPYDDRVQVLSELHNLSIDLASEIDDNQLLVLDVVASGGYGTVYRGTWQGLAVAVKTILFQESSYSRRVALQEAALSKSISHPNIVATYAVDARPIGVIRPRRSSAAGQAPGGGGAMATSTSTSSGERSMADIQDWRLYIIQEYCDGGTLLRALQGRFFYNAPVHATHNSGSGPPGSTAGDECDNSSTALSRGGSALPWGPNMHMVLELALGIASAIRHLHSKQVVHGDLNPRNVLLKRDGVTLSGYVPKVADFGMSVRMSAHQSHVSNVWQGTQFYAAPEQMEQGILTKFSDAYAFGVMLWELAHSQPVWVAVETPGRPGTQYVAHPDFPHLPPTVPPEYAALTGACLRPLHTQRPTFSAIYRALRSMQHATRAVIHRICPELEMVETASMSAASTATTASAYVHPAATAAAASGGGGGGGGVPPVLQQQRSRSAITAGSPSGAGSGAGVAASASANASSGGGGGAVVPSPGSPLGLAQVVLARHQEAQRHLMGGRAVPRRSSSARAASSLGAAHSGMPSGASSLAGTAAGGSGAVAAGAAAVMMMVMAGGGGGGDSMAAGSAMSSAATARLLRKSLSATGSNATAGAVAGSIGGGAGMMTVSTLYGTQQIGPSYEGSLDGGSPYTGVSGSIVSSIALHGFGGGAGGAGTDRDSNLTDRASTVSGGSRGSAPAMMWSPIQAPGGHVGGLPGAGLAPAAPLPPGVGPLGGVNGGPPAALVGAGVGVGGGGACTLANLAALRAAGLGQPLGMVIEEGDEAVESQSFTNASRDQSPLSREVQAAAAATGNGNVSNGRLSGSGILAVAAAAGPWPPGQPRRQLPASRLAPGSGPNSGASQLRDENRSSHSALDSRRRPSPEPDVPVGRESDPGHVIMELSRERDMSTASGLRGMSNGQEEGQQGLAPSPFVRMEAVPNGYGSSAAAPPRNARSPLLRVAMSERDIEAADGGDGDAGGWSSLPIAPRRSAGGTEIDLGGRRHRRTGSATGQPANRLRESLLLRIFGRAEGPGSRTPGSGGSRRHAAAEAFGGEEGMEGGRTRESPRRLSERRSQTAMGHVDQEQPGGVLMEQAAAAAAAEAQGDALSPTGQRLTAAAAAMAAAAASPAAAAMASPAEGPDSDGAAAGRHRRHADMMAVIAAVRDSNDGAILSPRVPPGPTVAALAADLRYSSSQPNSALPSIMQSPESHRSSRGLFESLAQSVRSAGSGIARGFSGASTLISRASSMVRDGSQSTGSGIGRRVGSAVGGPSMRTGSSSTFAGSITGPPGVGSHPSAAGASAMTTMSVTGVAGGVASGARALASPANGGSMSGAALPPTGRASTNGRVSHNGRISANGGRLSGGRLSGGSARATPSLTDIGEPAALAAVAAAAAVAVPLSPGGAVTAELDLPLPPPPIAHHAPPVPLQPPSEAATSSSPSPPPPAALSRDPSLNTALPLASSSSAAVVPTGGSSIGPGAAAGPSFISQQGEVAGTAQSPGGSATASPRPDLSRSESMAEAAAANSAAFRRESASLIREAFSRELQRLLSTSRRAVAAAGSGSASPGGASGGAAGAAVAAAGGGWGSLSPQGTMRRNLLVSTPRTVSLKEREGSEVERTSAGGSPMAGRTSTGGVLAGGSSLAGRMSLGGLTAAGGGTTLTAGRMSAGGTLAAPGGMVGAGGAEEGALYGSASALLAGRVNVGGGLGAGGGQAGAARGERPSPLGGRLSYMGMRGSGEGGSGDQQQYQ